MKFKAFFIIRIWFPIYVPIFLEVKTNFSEWYNEENCKSILSASINFLVNETTFWMKGSSDPISSSHSYQHCKRESSSDKVE